MKWILWPLGLAAVLTGALQVKEFIAPGYAFVRAGATAVFELVDTNIDRQTPPMEGLGGNE
jgi:hypothetical protein